MNELEQIAKILELNPKSTLAEICTEIGRLKERADNPKIVHEWTNSPMPLITNDNPNKHYHGTAVCYNNPCWWA